MAIDHRARWLTAALTTTALAAALRRDATGPLRAGPGSVPGGVVPPARFPTGFRFGAATSAHQVEGGTTGNNWTRWEQATRPDGRPGVFTGERCGDAADHWNRFESDVELLSRLGLDTYRFSLEWSRVEPEPGRIDETALERYRSWCVTLREAGIRPVVTLHHFTEPLWITDRGGFEDEATPARFEQFVERVVPALADAVDWWVTINEPNVFAVLGWLHGEFPPGVQDLGRTATVLRNVLEAHARAYHVIHRLDTAAAEPGGAPAQVSLAQAVPLFEPRSWVNPLDVAGARLLHRNFNAAPLEACRTGRLRFGLPGSGVSASIPGLAGTLDWIGVNHYFRQLVHTRGAGLPEAGFDDTTITNDMGWDLIPATLAAAVRWAGRFGLPIVVTEHGICDGEEPDRRRQWFLPASLAELAGAVAAGADVRGYLHWSLLDNFEWAHGFGPRFGLYRVDYDTQRRSLTGGGEQYRAVIAANRRPATDP